MRLVSSDPYLSDQPVKTLIVIILGILIFSSGFIYSFFPTNHDNLPAAEKEFYDAQYEAQHLPGSGGEILLTQKYMKASYRFYCERTKSNDPSGFGMLLGIFAGTTFLVIGLNLIRYKSIKDRGEMVSFSFYFKVALGGFVITLSLVLLLTVPSRARPASPEKATYYVDTFEVTRKEKKVETHYGRHGKSTTEEYYIYYNLSGQEMRREVPDFVYDSVKGPGTYYFLYAREGGANTLFSVCPDDGYRKDFLAEDY